MKLRTLLIPLCFALFIYGMLEGMSLILYSVSEGKLFSFAQLAEKRQIASGEKLSTSDEGALRAHAVVHPYVGMVQNPDTYIPNETHLGTGVNAWGFFDTKSSVQKRSNDRVLVGVFGGSVAWWFSAMGEAALKAELSKVPAFQNKRIEVLRIALGAYKQPQQALAFSYLLHQGAEFDLVISLDGFNEVTIPPSHTIPKGINPSFPAYWSELFFSFMPAEEQTLLGKALAWDQIRKKTASLAQAAPLRWSVSSNTLWLLLDRFLEQKVGGYRVAIKESKSSTTLPYMLRGPEFKAKEGAPMYEELARSWARGVRLMSGIAESQNIAYFHFLQPNQYIPGAKVLSAQERAIAFDENLFWKKHVEGGYPFLQAEARTLAAEGLPIVDLSLLFAGVEEPLYQDNCCHLNPEGNARIASHIGRLIAERLAGTP